MTPLAYAPPSYRYCFDQAAAGICVPANTTVSCSCPDSDGLRHDLTPCPDNLCDRSSITDDFEGNPVVAPVAIEGAAAGDCLCVEINALELDRRLGRTLLAPNHGLLRPEDFLADAPVSRHLYEWDIDVARNRATLSNPLGIEKLDVPLQPFIGCIGVAPSGGQRVSTLHAGDHGGNLDLPFIAPGAVLFLPIHVRGGNLSFGDIHAAQGHGEIVGGAIETSGRVTLTLNFIKGQTIDGPRVRDAQRLYAIATHADLREGFRIAAARLLRWVGPELGTDYRDAYVTLSQGIEMMAGNWVVSPYTVAAAVRIDALPTSARRRLGAVA